MKKKMKEAVKNAGGVFARAAKHAEEAQGGGNEWEDGRYAVVLSNLELSESKSGNAMVVLTFTGIDGAYKGEELKDFRVVGEGEDLDDEKLGNFFRYTLKPLGIEYPESQEEFEELLRTLTKKKLKVRVKVKTNGEYKNTYIEKPLSSDELEDSEGSEETAEDEDEGGVELEVGMTVTFENEDGDEVTGKIVKLLEKKKAVKVEDEDGETHVVPLADVQAEAAEDEDEDDSDDDDSDEEDEDDGEEDDSDDEEDDEEDEDEEEDEEPKKSKVSKKKSSLKKKK